jgi:hypothetical protein
MKGLTEEQRNKFNEAMSLIRLVKKSCEEGMDESWDCSTYEGREGFQPMIDCLDEAMEKLKSM